MTISESEHTYQRYDAELAGIRSLVLEMGGLVEEQIAMAAQALREGDTELAGTVIANDHRVNGLEVRIDEECTMVVARRQPMASDLRLIVAVIKTITDLERIGDEAEKIARMTLLVSEQNQAIITPDLLREVGIMAERARRMVRDALDAFARLDVAVAVEVAKGDAALDAEFRSALRHLVTFMMEDPRTIGRAIDVLFVVKALERIGDHAKNMAEYVIYLVKGKDVRHVTLDRLTHEALEEG
ncbi:phosphate signaling complex protein PhoU [Thermithiobacillus tepidarius DSM 3134]|uniref:phosphate signaling complex protein PhoU n=1 Tax=Thermithiobacillus tepidarius TaxID=929 RepID=UPI0004261310|nr:phosphate signaling complex protein PhoU [Thermithiobacillus tepidarius]